MSVQGLGNGSKVHVGFWVRGMGLGYNDMSPIMGNQMEKQIENQMETRVIWWFP